MELKPIKGFENYKINKKGEVFSPKGKRLKASYDKYGYRTVGLSKNGKCFRKFVHFLLLENFHSPCPPGKETNHKNGIKDDNRLENLEWVTSSENRQHAYDIGLKKGARNLGMKNGNSKLKDGEVWLIKKILSHRILKHKEIAKMFLISITMISWIDKGITWKHIKYK